MEPLENKSEARSLDPVEDVLIGRTIADRFHVLSLLAAGGMGRVYRAEQRPLGRIVALKVLRLQTEAWQATGGSGMATGSGKSSGSSSSSMERSDSMRHRFLREASVCAQLKHPNTITIFDYGCTGDNVYFIAMELLEGRNLEQAIKQDGQFAPERALRISGQICRALREAHGLGMVHRDLKPGNVFLVTHDDDPDYVKVLDFGLVKEVESTAQNITQTGFFVGSPCYMSPEQIRGNDIDIRTDIYSLGIILFQMLTGQVPFREKTAMDTVVAHMQKPPPSMSETNPNVRVPEPVEAVVMKAIAKDPNARFASMEHLLAALQRAARTANIPAFSTSSASGQVAIQVRSSEIEELPTRRHQRPRSRPFVLSGVAVAIAALLGAGVFWLTRGSIKEAEVKAAAKKTTTTIELRSVPPGVGVMVDGKTVCRSTPCDLPWQSDPGRPVRFAFHREGFARKEVERVVTGRAIAVNVMLIATPIAAKPRPAAAKQAASKQTPAKHTAAKQPPKKARRPVSKSTQKAAAPRAPKAKKKRKGYKDNPY